MPGRYSTLFAGSFELECHADGTRVMWFHPTGKQGPASTYVTVAPIGTLDCINTARAEAIALYNHEDASKCWSPKEES